MECISIDTIIEMGENMLVDSHIHLREKDFKEYKQVLQAVNLKMLVNTMNKEEYHKIASYFETEIENNTLYLSFGIHPWDADKIIFSDMEPLNKYLNLYQKAHAIGEIGLDNEWCEVDLEIQRKVFIAQLDMAEKLKKPIVLHTKGMEEEIAEIIKDYSVKKLVHWYDDEKHLDKYIGQDCYFTINPDYLKNPTIVNIIKRVPMSRLLLETDGIEALEWVFNRKISLNESLEMLENSMKFISDIKGIAKEDCQKILYQNFQNYLFSS